MDPDLGDDDVDGRRDGDGEGAVGRFPGRVDGAVVLAARVGARHVRRRVVVAERRRVVRPVQHLVDVRRRLAARHAAAVVVVVAAAAARLEHRPAAMFHRRTVPEKRTKNQIETTVNGASTAASSCNSSRDGLTLGRDQRHHQVIFV